VINDNHMLVTNLCFVADFILGYCHKYWMKWDPSIWIQGLKMDEYYNAKDFVSSKCHKEMKDTWIASL
jgi:hypothetical protein